LTSQRIRLQSSEPDARYLDEEASDNVGQKINFSPQNRIASEFYGQKMTDVF